MKSIGSISGKGQKIGSSHKVLQSSYGAKVIRGKSNFHKKMKQIIKSNTGANRGRIKM